MEVEVGRQETHYSWAYDWLDRMVEERVNGQVRKRWVWDGLEVVQERDGANRVVRNEYGSGFEGGGDGYVYTKDHLGSIREVVDGKGRQRARYSYGLWGDRRKQFGDQETRRGFTGHYQHDGTGLVFAPYRVYASEFGRWLSRDPSGELGGINLYGYVLNDPVNAYDPDGLDVVYLFDGDAATGYGHAAVLVGNDENGWHYFSKDGRDDKKSVNVHRRYGSIREFGASSESNRYQEAFRRSTGEEIDRRMIAFGESNFNSEYGLFTNNCGDLVNDILQSGDLQPEGDTFGVTVPRDQRNGILRQDGWVRVLLNL